MRSEGFVEGDAQILELLIRGAAVGAFLGAVVALARPPFTPARITGGLAALGGVGHALMQFSPVWAALGPAWPAVWALSAAAAGLLWAFVAELFGDAPRLHPLRLAPAGALLVLGLVARQVEAPALWLAHNLVGGLLMVHALALIAAGWRNDLVDSRRRLRGPVMAAATLYTAAVVSVQTVELFAGPASYLSPLAAGALFVLGLATLGAFLRPDPDLFAAVAPARSTAASEAVPELSADDARLAERLDRLMRDDRIYRLEALSVGGLARQLGVPEYRLRRLINRRLRHRNFAAFLNQWRLAEAREALADPSQREVPVATIALDAGFQSLGPFNRAFKAETGMTPTEFRNRQGGAGGG